MKKLLFLLATIILLLPCIANAESIDLSSMSTDALLNMRERINNEITYRTISETGKVILLDAPDGLTIYLSGKAKIQTGKSLSFEFVVINNGTTEKSCYYYTEAVNGWVSKKWYTMAKELSPGRKTKDNITFYDEEYIDSYDEPIILEFELFDGSSAFDKGDSLGKFKIIYFNDVISLAK